MYFKLSQLVMLPKSQSDKLCDVIIADVDKSKEMNLGKLFFIYETSTDTGQDKELITMAVNEILNSYYFTNQSDYKEQFGSLRIENYLENSLKKAESKIRRMCEDREINFKQKLYSITVGVIYKNSIYFSITGKNKALAITRTKEKNKDGSYYKLFDILRQSDPKYKPEVQNESVLLFSEIIAGKIPPEGYLIFSNEALPEYISASQLTKIITSLPPLSAVEQIKRDLEHVNAYIPFLAVIIKSSSLQPSKRIKEIKVKISASSQSSINRLNTTEKSTERYLSPSGMVSFKKWMELLPAIFTSKKGSSKYPSVSLGEQTILKKTRDLVFSKRIIGYVKKVAGTFFFLAGAALNQILHLIKRIFKKEQKPGTARPKKETVKKRISYKETLLAIPLWFIRLKTIHKLYIAILIISLIFFTVNLFKKNNQNIAIESGQKFIELSRSIEEKQNQIDSNLLYNQNGESIGSLLSQLNGLLELLPKETKEQKDFYEKYNSLYTANADKINMVERITDPDRLVELSNVDGKTTLYAFFKLKDRLVAFDSTGGRIFEADLRNGTATISTSTMPGAVTRSAVIDNEKIYILQDDGEIAVLDENSDISFATPVPKNPAGIKLIGFYNSRLYAVASSTNMIYRYSMRNGRFSGEEDWLTQQADLTGAVSMAINGKIYILMRDGNVAAFLRGAKDPFNRAQFEPKLEGAKKIIVRDDTKSIYILDQSKKRIVVLDKAGKLVRQYIFDTLTSINDVQIDENVKTGYLMDDSSVYSFKLSHLN